MADASSLRYQQTLPSAKDRNRGSVRFYKPTFQPVYSNGSEWINFGQAKNIFSINVVAPVAADCVTKPIYVANKSARILGISVVWSAAESSATALTFNVTKETPNVSTGVLPAPGAGTALLTTAISTKTTANTVAVGALTTNQELTFLNAGDRLSVVFSAAATELAGVVVTITMERYDDSYDIAFQDRLNANAADQVIFIATEPCVVEKITEVHTTPGSHTSAVVAQISKDSSTNAPGAGVDLITSTGFNMKATANVVQTATLTTTTTRLALNAGDRLAVDYNGTLTALAGVVYTITVRPLTKGTFTVNLQQAAEANLIDNCFFVATQPCYVLGVSQIHGTITTGAGNVQLTNDTGTDAPGAGTNMLSDNGSAGFNAQGTANTVQNGTLAAAKFLNIGDRLSVDYSAATAGGANFAYSVQLKYV